MIESVRILKECRVPIPTLWVAQLLDQYSSK